MTKTMTQIRDTHTDENGNVTHRWAIIDPTITTADGEHAIAELLVDVDTNEISWVWVHQSRRSEGLATRLYETAMTEMTIYHAPASHRTPEGDSFANRVGGPTMPDCTTCCADLDDDEEY